MASPEFAPLPVLNQTSRWVLVGSPNSGKTTVFNALTGLRNKVANFPGVTVDCSFGVVHLPNARFAEILDLPGTYSLDPLSPEEKLTLDYLRGAVDRDGPPEGVIFVADSTTLGRTLPLLGSLLRLLDQSEASTRPRVILVLTMTDELQARQGGVNQEILSQLLGISVQRVVGNRGIGILELRKLLEPPLPATTGEAPRSEIQIPSDTQERFAWADKILEEAYQVPSRGTPVTDYLDRWTLHPVLGILTFAFVMVLFFQAIFSWAVPLQDGIDAAVGWLSVQASSVLPDGFVQDLIVDGVFTGVGSVIVFIPQIALLFLLLTFFEQIGYMSRAVFVIDRLMRVVGLDGRAFVALLSSHACAIPGIMATRTMPDFRQRLTTIMVSPLMTCSARLPVYTLIIAAFIPSRSIFGFFNLQGLVMLGLYLVGAFSAMVAATILRRGPFAGQSMPFFVEIPPYRWPTLKSLWGGVWSPVSRFLKRAGTVILLVSMLLWALLAFPGVEVPPGVQQQGEAEAQAYRLERSLAGRLGKLIEPVFEPIGFDWRISIGLVASLAAREVVVATLAQVYSAGVDEEDTSLPGILREQLSAPNGDSSDRAKLAVALSLLTFFVFALQCVSTMAIMRRETGSWKLPVLAFLGLFLVAYGASFLVYSLALAV